MAKVVITIEDTGSGLFEIDLQGLDVQQDPTPAIIAGHSAAGVLRDAQKQVHAELVKKIAAEFADCLNQ
ncbi:hypothetical protein LVJ85_02235 [Neisseria sp. Dent CA1/247]|uniref:hypothetical protein n=1 Tax=Neisseria sp. Dent CA1/247 TaxID=2912675 RepID=UPI001FD4071C|nr:hypothetical protein [Neisseria sp. Dent CA1/247]UOO77340.1 hypothetical protein LVJ85_02235 [Neisseria sp. Dent CA1/247]